MISNHLAAQTVRVIDNADLWWHAPGILAPRLNALQASVINVDSIDKNPQTNKAIIGAIWFPSVFKQR